MGSVFLPALVAGVLLGGCLPNEERIQAPTFELTDQRGQTVELSNLQGRPVVLTFLYTNCPDTCPLYLFQIGQALASLKQANSSVSVIAVSVDPERDTQEHLRGFAGSWPPDWHFLTGRPTQVARVWNDYGVYVEKEEVASLHSMQLGYEVIHTAKLVVIDGEGYMAGELRGEWKTTELEQQLRLALAGTPGGSGRSLVTPLMGLLERCGEFAASHPWEFLGLVLLIMLPGLVLPAYLLRTFLRTSKTPRGDLG